MKYFNLSIRISVLTLRLIVVSLTLFIFSQNLPESNRHRPESTLTQEIKVERNLNLSWLSVLDLFGWLSLAALERCSINDNSELALNDELTQSLRDEV